MSSTLLSYYYFQRSKAELKKKQLNPQLIIGLHNRFLRVLRFPQP